MTNQIVDASERNAAKVAGSLFLFSIIGWLLYWIFILSRLTIAGDVTATAHNIIANEGLFRAGIAYEVIMAASVIVLAWALYVLLKAVDRNLALLGLCWKLAEAILMAVIALVSFIALQILNGTTYLAVFEPEQLQALVGLYLNVHTVVVSFSMVFLGLGSIVFFYLFLRSKYIPGILAGFGILSYSLILLYAFLNILVPGSATMSTFDTIAIICYAPSCLFEMIIGVWLLFKGVKVHPRDNVPVSTPDQSNTGVRS